MSVFCGRRNAQPLRLHVDVIVQFLIVEVHVNRSAGEGLKLLRTSDVIDMRVRDDNRLHAQTMLFKNRRDAAQFVAWIDDHGFAARLIAKDRTIALQRAHRQDFVNHNRILELWTQPYARCSECACDGFISLRW